jgi:hypothetical protein
MNNHLDPQLREALEELDGYLADHLPPLLVTDSFELFLASDPALLAGALYDWSVAQFRNRGGTDPLADLLFHCLKKVQLLEEFDLVPRDRFSGFLRGLSESLLAACPEAEAERLAGMLRFVREGRIASVSAVGRLYRAPTQGAPAAAGAPSPPEGEPALSASAVLRAEELASLRRFTALVERLAPAAQGGGSATGEAREQLLVAAATGAHDAHDLEARMARLHQLGVAPAVARDLVQAVAKALPDWAVHAGTKVELPESGSVEAVRRVVRLAGDGAKIAERWKDLLRTAAEEFNAGAWARAETLLQIAQGMVDDGSIQPRVADLARGHAHETFDPVQLLQCGAETKHRPILRRLVEFFPGWSARELLDALVDQPEQKKRRLILLLLEVWGADARPLVVERLEIALAQRRADPGFGWYLRNLVFLLHRLPRPAGADPRAELKLVVPLSTLGNHPSFQREAFAFLAGLPGGHGATTLVQRLADLERALEGPAPAPHEPAETWKLLNALAAALARCGSPTARRALVEHALAHGPKLGNAAARLRELSGIDLAGDREVLEALLGAIERNRPVKLFGLVVPRNEELLAHAVRALRSTTDPEAKRVLAELAAKFPDRDFGRLAGGGAEPPTPAEPDEDEGLLAFETPPAEPAREAASLAGDLEVFGLPGLLQSFQQAEVSGRLVLRDAAGERALFEIASGRLASCRAGRLRGEAAFYQVFELSAPGTFEFVRTPVAPPPGGGFELMGLLLEAMRRYDELRRLRALVPDAARLLPGTAKPTAPAEERDGELLRKVWARLRDGATPADCEEVAEVDAYRVRALLAHWLEEGASRIESAA